MYWETYAHQDNWHHNHSPAMLSDRGKLFKCKPLLSDVPPLLLIKVIWVEHLGCIKVPTDLAPKVAIFAYKVKS